MSLATDFASTAQELLTTFGQSVTFSRETQGTFVPSTGAVGSGSPSTFSAVVYPGVYKTNEIDGVSVLSTDTRLITYSSTKPLVGDTVSLNTQNLRVENVQNITVNAVSVLYICQCRV